MSWNSAHTRLLNLIAITALVAGLTAAQAQLAAGLMRPANIPENYVITPFGYFHSSCVMHLGKGDAVRQDQSAIRHADGSFESIHACAYSHFDAKGEKVSFEGKQVKAPAISHAWVEFASVTTSSSYGELVAYWTVPPSPSTNDGQTVYLFPGVEDYNDVVTIIQPVLGWNSDFASAWGIASWNCCVNGTVFESTPVRVNSGDTIEGYMWQACGAGVLSCASWDVVSYDVTSGNWTWLSNTSSHGQTFNWAFAGALEVYNISRCTDYPSNGSTSFYNLALYNDSYVKINNPGWSVSNWSSGLTPQCSYGGATPEQVNLTY